MRVLRSWAAELLLFTRSELSFYNRLMKQLTRITFNPLVMGGSLHPWAAGDCRNDRRIIRVGPLGTGDMEMYPYLEEEDLREALAYAAWRSEEIELPLVMA